MAASTSVISWNIGSLRLPMRVPQFSVRLSDSDNLSIIGMGSTPTVPAPPASNPSLMKSLVSRSRWSIYVAILGLFSADAAPFLLLFKLSLNGLVPIVVPAVFDSTLWNVQNTGLELSAWLLPPKIFLAASALFTTTTGSLPSWIWYTAPYCLDHSRYLSAALYLMSGMLPTSGQFFGPA